MSRPELPTEPLMTVKEVAELVQLSERLIWSAYTAKELPALRFGRAVQFDRRDVAAWIAKRRERVR